MPITAVAVFCGSKSGGDLQYRKDSETLGALLAAHGVALIYGGGKNGLMGYAADAAMQAGGTVRGVMPQLLMDKENGHHGISELIVVETIHERKRRMYELCDAAVILPGGFGTLDELFEMLTWNGLALHDKKIFLLNSGGFYDHLWQHLQRLEEAGFLYSNLADQITVLPEAAAMQPYLIS